jgi:hypothetical protein
MVTKSRNAGTKKAGKVRVGKLKLKKETVRDLLRSEKKGVKGGVASSPNACCPTTNIAKNG